MSLDLFHQPDKDPMGDVPAPSSELIPGPARWHGSAQRIARPTRLDRTPDWLHALNTVRRGWRLALSFAVTVVLAATSVTLLMKPIYAPVARIEIDPPGAEAFSLETGTRQVNEAEYLETSAQNLQSDGLAVAVIRKLRLDQNKEFTGKDGLASSVLRKLHGDGNKELAGKAVQNASNPAEETNNVDPGFSPAETTALKTFRSRLDVRRDTSSRLVSVSFASHDPRLAANIVNTLLNLFIERSYKARLDSIQQSTEWLSRQLDDVRKKMEDSNRALVQFQSKSGIADVDDNKNTFSEQMAELNHQRTLAQTERIQLGAVLGSAPQDSPDVLPQVQTNQVMQYLTQKLAEVQAELSQSLVIYGKNHPNVKRLQNQAAELEAQLAKQRALILGQLRTSYSAMQTREREIGTAMKKTNEGLGLMAQYKVLKKDAQSNAELYNALFQKIKEAGISAGSKSSGITIVDGARVLDQPTRPRRLLNIGLGLLVGLLGGVVLTFLREGVRNRIHTLEDIMSLGASPAVSIIPVLNPGNGARNGAKRLGLQSRLREGLPDKFLLERPRSPEAEALRGLQTSIMFSRRSPQVLLVTSSFPGEGKTTLALNLALALAQNAPTCLVEADLRKTGISGALGLKSNYGLVHVLSGSLDLAAALLKVPGASNLTFLPGGVLPAKPELVSSEGMRDLIRRLRESFVYIIVDSPPILPHAEARALATLVDGVVFVGRAGVTTREAIQRSMALLSEIHSAPIVELVLNAAEYISPEYQYY